MSRICDLRVSSFELVDRLFRIGNRQSAIGNEDADSHLNTALHLFEERCIVRTMLLEKPEYLRFAIHHTSVPHGDYAPYCGALVKGFDDILVRQKLRETRWNINPVNLGSYSSDAMVRDQKDRLSIHS